MKKTLAKVIISIAIGIIVGEYFGNTNEIIKYYYLDGSKTEVSENQYYEDINNEHFKDDLIKESHFNFSSFLTYGLSTTSILLIVFFVGDLLKKNEN